MKYALGTAVLALALAGCGSSDPDKDGDGKISVEEAAAEAERQGEKMKLEPGLYKSTTELVDLEMPDAPPEAKEMLTAMMGGEPRVMEHCVTPEEAEEGFEKLAKDSQSEDCSFDKFDVSGGKIDAVMQCEAPGDGKATIALNGTGTSTSSDMTMKMDAKGPNGETMKMTLNSKSERIGDCEG